MSAKSKSEALESRIMNQMQARDRRQLARLHLPATDARRLVRSILSRAEWLEKRREPDPVIRDGARREAAHCRRIADVINETLRGAA